MSGCESSGKKGRDNWVSAITNKIEQGNLKSAVQLLCSADGLAKDSVDTLSTLRNIHPIAPSTRRSFPVPEQASISFSLCQVLKALKSFNNGSSGGLDGLRPQQLKDLISAPSQADSLLLAITQFTNLLINGTCPPIAVPFFLEAV